MRQVQQIGPGSLLAALYPQFVHHGIKNFGSRDVLHFLGHGAPSRFCGELSCNLKHRPKGLCLRHRANGNSIKVYDNQGSVPRVETTIVHPEHFKGYRPAESQPAPKLRWQHLRKSVADLYRRAEISRGANGRYLGARTYQASQRHPPLAGYGARAAAVTALLAARQANVDQLTQPAA